MTNSKTTLLGHDFFNTLSIEEIDEVKRSWNGYGGTLFRAMTKISKTPSGFFEFCTVYPYLDDCANAGELAKKYWELKLTEF